MKRLGTDYIDLYFFHLNDCEPSKALAVMDVLETLVRQGKIRSYGWFVDNSAKLILCEEQGLSSINRAPLAMGLLTGKYSHHRKIDDKDVRGSRSPSWLRYFQNGTPSAAF